MNPRHAKVREHMVSPVHVVHETDLLSHVDQELSKWALSALPVVDKSGCMVGVLSQSDLLRAGRLRIVKNGHRRQVLTLPRATARELMTPTVEIVTADTRLAEAARRMLRQRIHRLYVAEDRRALGVISTREMMQAVVQARLTLPISELMHTSLISVKADDPLSLAIDRLTLAHHHGLLVLDDGWPVGVFSQVGALIARDAPPDERVDHWMDPALICLPLSTPAFRAAEQLSATRSKRVFAVDDRQVRGIVTDFDFLRLLKEPEPR